MFFIDFLGAFPFDLITKNKDGTYESIKMVKMVRILRFNRLIDYMNSTDDIKLSLHLLKTMLTIFLYIHITSCIWFYFTVMDKTWEPEIEDGKDFFEEGWTS